MYALPAAPGWSIHERSTSCTATVPVLTPRPRHAALMQYRATRMLPGEGLGRLPVANQIKLQRVTHVKSLAVPHFARGRLVFTLRGRGSDQLPKRRAVHAPFRRAARRTFPCFGRRQQSPDAGDQHFRGLWKQMRNYSRGILINLPSV